MNMKQNFQTKSKGMKLKFIMIQQQKHKYQKFNTNKQKNQKIHRQNTKICRSKAHR